MSRLIIKNLPKSIKEERLRSIFAAKGEITDLRLVYTKEGKFRCFGFVGFKDESVATKVLNYFNNTYIDTSKIHVEIAKDLGAALPRPWSKYTEGSSAHENRLKKVEEKSKRVAKLESNKHGEKSSVHVAEPSGPKRKHESKKKHSKPLEELESDEGFKEFLAVHSHRGAKQTWTNDETEKQTRLVKEKTKAKDKVEFDDSDKSSDEDYEELKAVDDEKRPSDVADDYVVNKNERNIHASDMDYLRSKIVKKGSVRKKVEETSLEVTGDDADQKSTNSSSDDDNDNDNDENNSDRDSNNHSNRNTKCKIYPIAGNDEMTRKLESHTFTAKLRGLPFKAKEKDIHQFFAPINVIGVRLPLDPKGRPSGNAFVDFSCEKDLKEALTRDRDYMKGRYIEVFRDSQPDELIQHKQADKRPWMNKQMEEDAEQEGIAESGRLFLRNLSYTCTEEDVEALFSKYGLLSEVHLPLDKKTSKTIGIGFVTFLIPEHAVKAFAELDGSVFQGRMLHLIPAKVKKITEDETVAGGTSSYKKKKDGKQKSLSSSEHNWNALFLGINAVADVMADKYNTKKSDILNAESSQSLAVRMALGETQVVAETRKFLVSYGVKLDVFGQPAAKRSKTVIIVKNLPYDTSSEELRNVFTPYGKLERVVLPPSGITALVEFAEPSEAKKAFLKLAYTKFKHVPLYLEWAPLDVFVSDARPLVDNQVSAAEESKQNLSEVIKDESGKESDIEADEGATVFVKNLNFSTNEETLKQKFASVGPLLSVTISKKKDPNKKGNLLSMGYGFIEFKQKKHAAKALKDLQHCKVDGHSLELKLSHRKPSGAPGSRKKAVTSKQTSSKLLVRNVPFEASLQELKELFSTFGEIKTLRLPAKMSGTGKTHRGFAFVDFLTKQDAKRAFQALSTSTHLYGRRLVLEWAKDEDTVETLRKRTAEHFHGTPKKKAKKQNILDNLMDAEAD